MNDAKLLVVTIGALSLLIASAVFCVFLLRKLRRLESQQDRWRTESRRLEQLQGSFLANMKTRLNSTQSRGAEYLSDACLDRFQDGVDERIQNLM